MTPEREAHLAPGRVLEPDLRKVSHPVPVDLVHRLPPPPVGHRYVAVGGHVAIVDHDYRVQDVITTINALIACLHDVEVVRLTVRTTNRLAAR